MGASHDVLLDGSYRVPVSTMPQRQLMHELGSDNPKVANAVRTMSLILWAPQILGMSFVLLQGDMSAARLIAMLVYMIVIIATTYFVATKRSGDLLMVVMWLVGISSEVFNVGSTPSEIAPLPRNYWIALFAVQGVFSGILCKAKDVYDERYVSGNSVVERLYLVTPFTVGQWTAYVLLNGWGGLLNVVSSIFLCLATVGYGAMIHKYLSRHGLYTADPAELISNVFTTSFGVVLTSLLLASFLIIYMAIPLISVLITMNAVVSSFGIIGELVMYDLA